MSGMSAVRTVLAPLQAETPATNSVGSVAAFVSFDPWHCTWYV